MKYTKHIDTKLNNKFDARYSLEVIKDPSGPEKGKLTVPFIKWIDADNPTIQHRYYEINNKLLSCIEKQYFDNNITAIPIKDYSMVEMADVVEKILPEKLYNQMLNGTFEIAEFADKSIYGNLPVNPNLNLNEKITINITDLMHEKALNVSLSAFSTIYKDPYTPYYAYFAPCKKTDSISDIKILSRPLGLYSSLLTKKPFPANATRDFMHHMILDSMKDKPILNTAGKYDYTYSSHKNDKFWFSVVTNDNNTLNGHIKNITFKTIPEDAVKREYPNSITFDGPYKTSKEATAALQKTAHTMKNNPLFGEVTIAVKTNLPKKARSL